jgi:hypothetical protein
MMMRSGKAASKPQHAPADILDRTDGFRRIYEPDAKRFVAIDHGAVDGPEVEKNEPVDRCRC